MLQPFDRTARLLAAATILGTVLATAPVYAASTAPSSSPSFLQLAQADQATPPKPATARRSSADRIEDRIASLHQRLKITEAQAPQWNEVAQIMRENGQGMHALAQQRKAKAKGMTAVEDLHSYEEIAAAHAEGLKKLIPAFERLYATMSDDQKKNADLVFGHPDRRRSQRQSPSAQ